MCADRAPKMFKGQSLAFRFLNRFIFEQSFVKGFQSRKFGNISPIVILVKMISLKGFKWEAVMTRSIGHFQLELAQALIFLNLSFESPSLIEVSTRQH